MYIGVCSAIAKGISLFLSLSLSPQSIPNLNLVKTLNDILFVLFLFVPPSECLSIHSSSEPP